MTFSQQLLVILRLWGGRLGWFLVAAMVAVSLLHLPYGVVQTGHQAPPPVGPPRNDPTIPFRVEPLERRQPLATATWAFAPYSQAVQSYLKNLATGELSIRTPQGQEPLLPRIGAAWAASLRTFGSTLGAGFLAGLLLGALSLTSRLGRGLSFTFSVFGLALPDFFLILLGQMLTIWTYRVFEVRLWSVLGAGGERGWLLPFLVMTIGTAAYAARLTATGMDEVLREDYIRTARAKGVPEHRVLLGHALRNALPRVLNGVPAMISASLSSLIIVEMLTANPGLGAMLMGPGGTEMMATVMIIFCGWFVVMDAIANSLRLLVSPRLKEVVA